MPIVSPFLSRGGRTRALGPTARGRTSGSDVMRAARSQTGVTEKRFKVAPSGPISRIPSRHRRSRSFLLSRGHPRARAADPEAEPLTGSRDGRPLPPYLALLRMGFTVPPPLPAERCALTAPFHPCRPFEKRRFVFCCTFRRVAATGRLPGMLPVGVRTFLSGSSKRSPERSRGPLGAASIIGDGWSLAGVSPVTGHPSPVTSVFFVLEPFHPLVDVHATG